MNSIFDIENRLNIKKEFTKLINVFFDDKKGVKYKNFRGAIVYSTLVEAINDIVFLKWKYRDTFLDMYEYLEHIGVTNDNIQEALTAYIMDDSSFISKFNKNIFLNFIEFFINMNMLLKEETSLKLSEKVIAALNNLQLILEKMNYKTIHIDDKIIISKRDADVDSVLNKIPEDISIILLEFNDFKIKDNLLRKKEILKQIDLYIEKNIKVKEFDQSLDSAIGFITNKLGINHPNEDFNEMDNKSLLNWYDKCFILMLHAIRQVEVIKIKKEKNQIIQEIKNK